MFEQTLPRPYLTKRLMSEEPCRAVSPTHNPRQNQLLAALPPEDYARLLPHLKAVSLPPGWIVHDAGARENYLYFLTEGIVSRCHVSANGSSAVLALTGSEGVIGVVSYLGGGNASTQAVVLNAGFAYRLDAALCKSGVAFIRSLQRSLLRYATFLVAQVGQAAACYRHHTLEQQLCYWILSCLDRLPSNELTMTHELISNMLGARRESITGSAGNLQNAGLIHTRRGRITVLDRLGLEARVCECYGVVRREFDRIYQPKYTIGNAHLHRVFGHTHQDLSVYAGCI